LKFVTIAITAFCYAGICLAGNFEAPGVPNFHQLNDQVYRGAQPTDEGFVSLAKLGIKTVIDLRGTDGHSPRAEQQAVEANGMHYVSFPMHGMATPSDEEVAKILATLQDATAGPVFVHCMRGADRTGAVMAVYRMVHDQWTNAQALKEAKDFGMSGFQRAIQHYITRFQASQLAAFSAPAVVR
jgi:protein tyrosine/serine phosphatase